MTSRLSPLLFLLICACSSENQVDNSTFEIVYTNRVKPEKAKAISEYITFRQNESGYLNGVDKIKIDSNYFSYQLFLAGNDTIVKRNAFQAFAQRISSDLLDSAAVHVFITDKSFTEIIVPYKFSNKVISAGRQVGIAHNLKISFPADMNNTIPRALFDELRVNVPELLMTGDTLEINIDRQQANYAVDIYVDPGKIDIGKLKNQFGQAACAPLVYNILFDYTPTYISVRNSVTRQSIFVMTHGLN